MVQWWLCKYICQTKKQCDNSFTIEEIPKEKDYVKDYVQHISIVR